MCHSCNPALNVVSTSFFILCFFPEILADLKELSVFHFLSSVSCDSLCFPPSSLCSCHCSPAHSAEMSLFLQGLEEMLSLSSEGSEMGSEKEQSPEPHLPEEGEGGKPWRVDDSEGSWIPPGEKEHGQESLSDELQETHPKKPWQKVTVPAREPGDPIAHPRHEADEKPFICAQCGKTFNNTSNLRTHQRIHTGEKPYKCSECGKSFSRSSNRIRHERIHLEEKHYKCPKCQESFRRRSDLTTHQQDHLGKRPYRCDICGKSFSQSATLAVHHRTHLEPAPYICCECGKSFSNSSSFGVHHRTHTGERPYECTECGRTFSDISNFGAHQRTHRGEKPYRCTVCGKHFSRSSNLIRHQKTHLGEQAGKDSS
nr:zinc finger protein 691 isoform X1 [Macaca nemestrina]XP_011762071.1 zinc finger protein 691 isoform X1 [Macaca nemestrina]